MSYTKIEESCRSFLEVEEEVEQWVLSPVAQDYRTEQVWPRVLDGRIIFDEIAPVPLRIGSASGRTRDPAQKVGTRAAALPDPHRAVLKSREDAGRFWSWLEAQACMQSPISAILADRLPAWRSRTPEEIQELLAAVLLVVVRLIKSVVNRRLLLTAPPVRPLLNRGTVLQADYLLCLLDDQAPHGRWHLTGLDKPVPANCTATLEHCYPEGIELRFPHPQGGWVRAIVPSDKLPEEAEEGDSVEVRLHENEGSASRCEVIPGTWKMGSRSALTEFDHLLPEEPKDWSDAKAVAEYRKKLREVLGDD